MVFPQIVEKLALFPALEQENGHWPPVDFSLVWCVHCSGHSGVFPFISLSVFIIFYFYNESFPWSFELMWPLNLHFLWLLPEARLLRLQFWSPVPFFLPLLIVADGSQLATIMTDQFLYFLSFSGSHFPAGLFRHSVSVDLHLTEMIGN